MPNRYPPIDPNLTTSVRFVYEANLGVDYRVEEYYTDFNKVNCPMRVDFYIKQETS